MPVLELVWNKPGDRCSPDMEACLLVSALLTDDEVVVNVSVREVVMIVVTFEIVVKSFHHDFTQPAYSSF